MESSSTLTMQTADEMLTNELSVRINMLTMDLSNRFRAKMGLNMNVCVPAILIEGSE